MRLGCLLLLMALGIIAWIFLSSAWKALPGYSMQQNKMGPDYLKAKLWSRMK